MAEDMSVEVYTDWVSGGESAALNAIAKAFEAKGGKWIDDAVPGDTIAPAVSRIVADEPMGVAKMHPTNLDELHKAGRLADIDEVAADGKWQDRVPEFMWKFSIPGGHVFGAPINSKSEVWLWDNEPVVEKVDTPSLHTLMRCLRGWTISGYGSGPVDGHGRLGQGRVYRGGPDGGHGIWLHVGAAGRQHHPDRRHVHLPQDRRATPGLAAGGRNHAGTRHSGGAQIAQGCMRSTLDTGISQMDEYKRR